MNSVATIDGSTTLPAVSNETQAVMAMIERVAMSPDADIEKLERMLDMQERILNRNAKQEFSAALAMMQSELPEVEKLADGHNSKYAKFDMILAAIKPSLKEYGFAITHRCKVEGALVTITAVLSHKGGHSEETSIVLPPDNSGSKNAVQAVGSSMEYGRRYTMNSLLGIATKDADTDGGRPKGPTLVSDDQIKKMSGAIKVAGVTEADFCKKAGIKELSELPTARFAGAMNHLKKQTQGDAK